MCLQMAPYNTQYERLPVHLAAAGIEAGHNFWDQPVTLALPHKPAAPDSGQSRPAFSLLPPEKLLPFMVPFQGGRGPLCGGAASGGITRCAADPMYSHAMFSCSNVHGQDLPLCEVEHGVSNPLHVRVVLMKACMGMHCLGSWCAGA